MLSTLLKQSVLRPVVSSKVKVNTFKLLSTRQFHASAPARKEEEVSLGLIDKYQLYEPSRYVPATVGVFTALWGTGLYHFNEESQLLGLFCLFVGTIYSKGGDAIGKMLDEVGDAVQAEHNALENNLIDGYRDAKKLQEESLDVMQDIIGMYEQQKDLVNELTTVQPHLTRQKTIANVERLLSVFGAQENKIQLRTESALVDGAAEAVKNAFIQDPKLQASAMDAAFASLANPDAAQKSDIVGELYSEFFEKFRESAWKDKAQNPTVAVSVEIQEEAENARKMIVEAIKDSIDGDANAIVTPVGEQYNYAADGLEGVMFTSDVQGDERYQVAFKDNEKFMDAAQFSKWQAAAAKVEAKEL